MDGYPLYSATCFKPYTSTSFINKLALNKNYSLQGSTSLTGNHLRHTGTPDGYSFSAFLYPFLFSNFFFFIIFYFFFFFHFFYLLCSFMTGLLTRSLPQCKWTFDVKHIEALIIRPRNCNEKN